MNIPAAKFSLGQTVCTANLINTLSPEEAAYAQMILTVRHAKGDWGDLGAEDKAQNEWALANGERLFSSYNLPSGKKVYIITEWDRSVTTLLLPEDY